MTVEIGTAYVAVEANLDGFQKSVSSKMDSLGKSLVSKGKMLSATLTAPIAGLFATGLNEAFEATQVAQKVAATLQSTGNGAVVSAAQVDALSDSVGKLVVADNEAVAGTANLILTMTDLTKFGGDADEMLQMATETSYNYAAATGTSAESATKLFSTLMNTPQKAIPKLLKLGVINEKQAETYKKMIENGKGVAVSQELMTKASERFGGAAEANALPMDKLKIALADFTQILGEMLLPFVQKAIETFQSWVEKFQDLSPSVQKVVGVVLGLLAALGPVLIIGGKMVSGMKSLVGGIKAVGSAFKVMGSGVMKVFSTLMAHPFLLIAAVIIVLAVLIWKNWDTIKAFLLKIWDGLKKAWEAVWNGIKKAFKVVSDFISKAIQAYVGFWVGVFNKVKDGVIAVWNGIKGAWQGALDWFSNLFQGIKDKATTIFTNIKNFVVGIWDEIVGNIKKAINLVIDGVNVIIKGINLLPGVDIPSIPHLAKGGIVQQPTLALVGEAGPEAVVPLSQLGSLTGGGRLEIVDWRRGIATLSRELDHSTFLRGE